MNETDKKILDDGVATVKHLMAHGKEREAKDQLTRLYVIAARMQVRDDAEKVTEVTHGIR